MKKLYCLFLFVLASQLHAGYVWYTFEANQHKYALTSVSGTWEAARLEAVSVGGHLVTINNAGENQFLADTFRDLVGNVYDIAWIGLEYTGSPSCYTWINGEPADYLNLYNEYYYSHWYIHLGFHNNTWNSNPFHDTAPGAGCQGIIEILPEPATLMFLSAGICLAKLSKQ